MSQPIIQTSFNSGEWAPALNARVDLAKYHSGAALIRNFFVDYRGGATTRPGTKYILQALGSRPGVRLIPFQASFTVSYVLEFGAGYIRFYTNGAPVLETAKAITNVNIATDTITAPAHGFSANDWVFISGIIGTTQLNGGYYKLFNVTANTFQLTTLDGILIDFAGFSPYISGGRVQRVYTVATTYLATEVFGIKYAQNVNTLILCHPNHPPSQLVLNVNVVQPSWSFSTITFGSTVTTPGINTVTSTLPTGGGHLAYEVTAVDVNGQESGPTIPLLIDAIDLNTTGSQLISIATNPNATSFNVYRANPNFGVVVPAGVPFGFIGSTTSQTYTDTTNFNIAYGINTPDFSQTPPVPQNPFAGAGVQSLTIVNPGSGFIAVPTITFSPPASGTATASATCTLTTASVTLSNGGDHYAVGDILFGPIGLGGIEFIVTGINPIHPPTPQNPVATGPITAFNVLIVGTLSSGPAPDLIGVTSNGAGTGALFGLIWVIGSVTLIAAGAGYVVPPTVGTSGGGNPIPATITATLGASSAGNPTVPGFHQQRMFLGGQVSAPSQFNLSQPGSPYNYNITFPAQADNAIQGTLTNTTLNSIKSIVSVPAGLIVFADKGAWLLNGGSAGSPVSALDIVANPQAYSGASDLPPIVTPNDILYVQAKGSTVRDLAYNFYVNNYVGADISVLSSHLFYGFQIVSWAWAEEPFKVVWAVRNDGVMLSCTFVKEQELIAWAQHNTQGSFLSVCSVTESTTVGNVDAVYAAVVRIINGVEQVYIERFVELTWPQGYKSSWQVDAGIQYSGAPATSFSGAIHLRNKLCTGVADGAVISVTPDANGNFTLATAASLVTIGLAFTPQIQTLALDLGEPTSQGKVKSVTGVTIRVANALGLSAGKSLSDLKPMKDLQIGQVSTTLTGLPSQTISDLTTGDAFITLPPQYDTFGQYIIQQPNPYPASVLGVIPRITVGDTP